MLAYRVIVQKNKRQNNRRCFDEGLLETLTNPQTPIFLYALIYFHVIYSTYQGFFFCQLTNGE